MLSVEPILERTFLTSGVGAVAGRLLVLVVVLVVAVVELARGARGTGGFLSGTVLVMLLVVVAGLVVRVRAGVLPVTVDGLAVVDLALVESMGVNKRRMGNIRKRGAIDKPLIIMYFALGTGALSG